MAQLASPTGQRPSRLAQPADPPRSHLIPPPDRNPNRYPHSPRSPTSRSLPLPPDPDRGQLTPATAPPHAPPPAPIPATPHRRPPRLLPPLDLGASPRRPDDATARRRLTASTTPPRRTVTPSSSPASPSSPRRPCRRLTPQDTAATRGPLRRLNNAASPDRLPNVAADPDLHRAHGPVPYTPSVRPRPPLLSPGTVPSRRLDRRTAPRPPHRLPPPPARSRAHGRALAPTAAAAALPRALVCRAPLAAAPLTADPRPPRSSQATAPPPLLRRSAVVAGAPVGLPLPVAPAAPIRAAPVPDARSPACPLWPLCLWHVGPDPERLKKEKRELKKYIITIKINI